MTDNEKRMEQNDFSSNSNKNMEGKLKYYLIGDESRHKSNKKVVRFSGTDTVCAIYPQDWEEQISSWKRDIKRNKKDAHKCASRLKRSKEAYASTKDQLDEERRLHYETLSKMETLEQKNKALQRLCTNLSKETHKKRQISQPHYEEPLMTDTDTRSIRTRSLDFISKIEKDLLKEVVTRKV
jgi:hypothetical protein